MSERVRFVNVVWVNATSTKSACVWCPYHSDVEWRRIRDTDPDGWSRALTLDDLIRGGVRGTTDRLYLHRSRQPLRDVDLSTAEERGQLSLWDEECEGLCGT